MPLPILPYCLPSLKRLTRPHIRLKIMFDTLPYDLYHSYRRIMKRNYDFIHNRGIIEMTDLTSKQVIVDGKKAFVSKDEGDQLYLYFEQGDVGWCNKSRVLLIENTTQQSPKDSLLNLQNLCTTNNIHILISKNESSRGSYQIWDEYSDDTYEMNNVDDVIKAIECLNELKKWRQ